VGKAVREQVAAKNLDVGANCFFRQQERRLARAQIDRGPLRALYPGMWAGVI
jgi:hypothetical protein